jgi:predicted DNA-binding transcriptional regulator AlpA
MTTALHSPAAANGGPGTRPGGAAELLDVRGVAELLGVSARTVARLTDGGKMPRPVKLGALVR